MAGDRDAVARNTITGARPSPLLIPPVSNSSPASATTWRVRVLSAISRGPPLHNSPCHGRGRSDSNFVLSSTERHRFCTRSLGDCVKPCAGDRRYRISSSVAVWMALNNRIGACSQASSILCKCCKKPACRTPAAEFWLEPAGPGDQRWRTRHPRTCNAQAQQRDGSVGVIPPRPDGVAHNVLPHLRQHQGV